MSAFEIGCIVLQDQLQQLKEGTVVLRCSATKNEVWTDFAVPIAILLSAVVATIAFAYNVATNKFTKSIDVMMKCTERYDEIHRERAAITDRTDPLAVEALYKRFWSLQQFQYEMFLLGMIESEIYFQWMLHKLQLFKQTDPIGGYTLSKSWLEFGIPNHRENTSFLDFFSRLRSSSEMPESSPGNPETRQAVRSLVNSHERQFGEPRRRTWFTRGVGFLRLQRP